MATTSAPLEKKDLSSIAQKKWEDHKNKFWISLLVTLSMFTGFIIGVSYSQSVFNHSAINSGHAQHNPISGKMEWKVCNK